VQHASDSEDLRVRRTRKLMQDALIELTVEKGFAAVTVRDITERAMVNRSTFYRHYLDKYALIDQYLDEVQHDITTAHREQKANPSKSKVPAGLVALLGHIQSYPEFFRLMLGAGGDARFIARFRSIIENQFRILLAGQEGADLPPLDFRLAYISGADIGAILWWLESGQRWTLEELAVWIGRITTMSTGLPPHG
jgi:AcrR family transcriptional regulator